MDLFLVDSILYFIAILRYYSTPSSGSGGFQSPLRSLSMKYLHYYCINRALLLRASVGGMQWLGTLGCSRNKAIARHDREELRAVWRAASINDFGDVMEVLRADIGS